MLNRLFKLTRKQFSFHKTVGEKQQILDTIFKGNLHLPSAKGRHNLFHLLENLETENLSEQQVYTLIRFSGISNLRKQDFERTIKIFERFFKEYIKYFDKDKLKDLSYLSENVVLFLCLQNLQFYNKEIFDKYLEALEYNQAELAKSQIGHNLLDFVFGFIKMNKQEEYFDRLQSLLKGMLMEIDSYKIQVQRIYSLFWLISAFNFTDLQKTPEFTLLVSKLVRKIKTSLILNTKTTSQLFQGFAGLDSNIIRNAASYRAIDGFKTGNPCIDNMEDDIVKLVNNLIAHALIGSKSVKHSYHPVSLTEMGMSYLVQENNDFYNTSSTEAKFYYLLQKTLETSNIRKGVSIGLFEVDYLVNDRIPVELNGATHYISNLEINGQEIKITKTDETNVKTGMKNLYCKQNGYDNIIDFKWEDFYGKQSSSGERKQEIIKNKFGYS